MSEGVIFCSGAILVRSGQYLLGKRSQDALWFAGRWDIFGGHVEAGETPEDALKRECKEELGIVPSVWKLFKTVEERIGDPPRTIRLFIYFVSSWLEGEPGNCSAEHSEIKWLSRAEVAVLNLASPEYVNLIDEWERKSMAALSQPFEAWKNPEVDS